MNQVVIMDQKRAKLGKQTAIVFSATVAILVILAISMGRPDLGDIATVVLMMVIGLIGFTISIVMALRYLLWRPVDHLAKRTKAAGNTPKLTLTSQFGNAIRYVVVLLLLLVLAIIVWIFTASASEW